MNIDVKKILEKVKKEMNLSDDIIPKIESVIKKNLTNKDGIIKDLVEKVNLSEIDAKKIYDKVVTALKSDAGQKIADKVIGLFNKK